MDQLKVGWIGFGNMAKAMAQGLIGSGRIAPDALYWIRCVPAAW